MNKFVRILSQSHSKIRETRAKIIAEEAAFAQEDIVRNLEKEKREINSKLDSLTDMNPDSRLSLQVVKADFNAESILTEIQQLKIDLVNKKVELKIAKDTQDEWFGEEEEEDEKA